MPEKDTDNKGFQDETKPVGKTDSDVAPKPDGEAPPKEIGGRKGLDPTRYGDWEKAGRCIDF
jgi:hypothetical protein